MLSEFLLLRAADRRLAATQMDLRFQRFQPTLLANELSHDRLVYSKSLGELRVAPFLLQIRGDNPLPQVC